MPTSQLASNAGELEDEDEDNGDGGVGSTGTRVARRQWRDRAGVDATGGTDDELPVRMRQLHEQVDEDTVRGSSWSLAAACCTPRSRSAQHTRLKQRGGEGRVARVRAQRFYIWDNLCARG